jgi:pimeloyl-ACP methyl ester carboxylesterase
VIKMDVATVPGYTSHTADVDGVRLHYRLGGDPSGRPVLLWHGFLGTSYVWRKVMPALAAAWFAVLAPDMRGYGDSDKPDGTIGYDARALAEEFRSLVRVIGFGAGEPITLVAHDMGAPPALLWAADHPDEISGLLYLEEPVLLPDLLSKIIVYTPEAAARGSMWWWLLPLAPGLPERLVVGNERAFLTWFYDRDPGSHDAIEAAAIDETLRTFTGREGVLGALGVYRAAFTTMEQTAELTRKKVTVSVVGLGGAKAQGDRVQNMLRLVATSVSGGSVENSGHFLPEENPSEVVRHILQLVDTTITSAARTPTTQLS